jgi:sugar/nucleoside kinase (ribokinase family)
MSVVVVGSLALDTIQTPSGERTEALGGSAVYFSTAASFFTDVKLVGVVGRDFPREHLDLLRRRGVDLAGLQTAEGSTFRWSGRYEGDMSQARTLDTRLNVFGAFRPVLPESYRDADAVFLANIDPDLQLDVLSQVRRPKMVAADTMNLWITSKRDRLIEILPRVNLMILNDAEARQLTGETGLVKAGRKIQALGPSHVVIKKGEHGSILFSGKNVHVVPAYPLEDVRDPTGAGDTFAGGFIGYLNKMKNRLTDDNLHTAQYYGTVLASFTVEEFSLDRLKRTTFADVRSRLRRLVRIVAPRKLS